MAFDFLGRVNALSPANLTIREQVRLAENPNDLRWRAIFPRMEARSIRIRELSRVDARFIGGRREWNADGREIPDVLGALIDAKIVPINPTKHLDEERLQVLREGARGNSDLFNSDVVMTVDQWATALADAADRQIERDAFQAWFNNTITVMDPKTGTTTSVAVGIDTARYVTGSALSAATSAYVDFMGYLRDARSTLGSVGAVRMRQSLLNEILADAPAFSGDTMSLRGFNQRIQDEGFGDVQIVIDERTYHTHTDGGSAYTVANYVPSDRIAFQPAGGRVGYTHFAPVTRAYDYMNPAAVRNINDFAVFYSAQNDGKTLKVEAQANALSIPEEQNVYVVTALA